MKNLGDTVYWVESGVHYRKTIPCPMCFGKRFITVILGDESKVDSECEMCTHGLDRATGFITIHEADSLIRSGVITGISTRDGAKYEVGHTSVFQHDCFDSEAAAIPTRDKKLQEEKDRVDRWYKDSFVNTTKKQLWSVGYHRNQIKYNERQIDWHKARLMMCKDKA